MDVTKLRPGGAPFHGSPRAGSGHLWAARSAVTLGPVISRSPSTRFGVHLLGLAFVASLSAIGCRNANALRQKCLSGDDLSACEGACGKGIAGEGGCFHAGEQHRARAALDFGSAAWATSADFFRKSCDGGYADGCLFAAQAVEAPFGSYAEPASGELRSGPAAAQRPGELQNGPAATRDPSGPRSGPAAAQNPGGLPRMIGDADVRLREQRLTRACTLGSAAGCKRLGDVLIGKASDKAREAYLKACGTSAEPAACAAARGREVDLAEQFRAACTHRQADACTSLGNFLFAVDPPRAARLFASECELRGTAEIAGGLGAFVRARAREAQKGIPLPEGARPAPPPPGAVPADARTVSVRGPVALVEVDRALSQRRDDLTTCMATLPASVPVSLSATLVVDRTGDVFRATVTDTDASSPRPGGAAGTPPAVLGCLRANLEALSFTEPPAAPGDLPTVEVTITRPAAAIAR